MKLILYKIYKVLPVWLRWQISYFLSDKFVVGIKAIVVKNKQILLVKNSYQYYWSLPGGYLQRGESVEDSIKREIKEEVGLNINVAEILQTKSLTSKAAIDILLVCRVTGGSIKIDHKEIEEAKFFNPDQLPFPEQMPESQLKAINLWINNR